MTELDLSEIAAFRRQSGPKCKTCRVLAGQSPLTEREMAMLKEWLDRGQDLKLGALWAKSKGADISPVSVQRHQRGECLGGQD